MGSPETTSDSAARRDALGHPVVDTDGHVVEFRPVIEEYLAEFAGAKGVDRYRNGTPWYRSDDSTRRRLHLAKPSWGFPARTMDHMASILPALLVERMGELGIDFVVMHPSPKKLGVPHLLDDELRQPMCRALNAYMADLLAPHAAQMTPAAVIPMHHPTEAIEELDYAVNTLGMKTTMVASYAERRRVDGEPGTWWDNFVLDSEYDYDPVWEKFQELKIVPAFHSGTLGIASRIVSTNSTYNFIGHCAAAQEAICKALVLGGVTHRFPDLKFAFEVSGISWAVALFSDLVDQWESRNFASVSARDPARFDMTTAEVNPGIYVFEPQHMHHHYWTIVFRRRVWNIGPVEGF
jgi:predicted TIM-barrel fold metal-dependent hydrolase